MVAPLRPRRTAWKARDLVETDFPPPRWAVPGIVAEGLTLFAGPPKVGKSWMALGLSLAVASGGHALGKVSVQPGSVLYAALEDTPRRLKQRLLTVIDGGSVPEPLTFWTEWPDDGANELDQWLGQHPDCRLVVVDVLAKVRGISDPRTSAYESDYAAVTALKNIADKHGIALLALHHVRKAGSEDFVNTVSGTHGLAGAADAILVMTRGRNSADAKLHVTGRDVEEAEYAMDFDATLGAWKLLDGPASDYELGDTRRRILELLRENQPMTPKAIADTLGLTANNTKVTLHRMAEDGQLDRADGYYTTPVTSNPGNPVTTDGLLGYGGYSNIGVPE